MSMPQKQKKIKNIQIERSRGEIMKNTKRAKSLYISLIEESSERLEVAEEMIAILKKAITNSVNG